MTTSFNQNLEAEIEIKLIACLNELGKFYLTKDEDLYKFNKNTSLVSLYFGREEGEIMYNLVPYKNQEFSENMFLFGSYEDEKKVTLNIAHILSVDQGHITNWNTYKGVCPKSNTSLKANIKFRKNKKAVELGGDLYIVKSSKIDNIITKVLKTSKLGEVINMDEDYDPKDVEGIDAWID